MMLSSIVKSVTNEWEREREMFYLTTHSTHFIYGYMASDIWLRTILIVRKETRCRHIGYSYRLTARVLLYAPSHRQDNTYHGLCYTSRGALAGTRNSSMGPLHEGSIRRPIAPWANALTTELHFAPVTNEWMNEQKLIVYWVWRTRTNLCVVGRLADDLWGHPEGSAHKRIAFSDCVRQLPRHSEIGELDIAVFGQQHVGSWNRKQ